MKRVKCEVDHKPITQNIALTAWWLIEVVYKIYHLHYSVILIADCK
jgi:hypothetical protein